MAAIGQVVTVTTAATLIFEVVDGVTYAGLSNPAANVFKAESANDPLPILLLFPNSTIYLGGSTVTSSSTGVGALCDGTRLSSLSYNCVGGDSLYGIVASSTANIQILVLRQ